jgi:hypothetical protein
MPLRCEVKSALLQQPEAGLSYPVQESITTSPFTLSGAPMNNRPESSKGLSEFQRRPQATKNFALADLYFDRQNYYEIYLQSDNILETIPGTTLRYEETTYTLQFSALHRGIWDTSKAQFSMFFTNGQFHFFHICIPVEYTQSEEGLNPFLSSWLSNTPVPSGFTMNDIFQLQTNSSKNLQFAVLPFCLEYNKGRNSSTYTYVLFQNAARVSKKSLPKWLQEDPLFQKDVPIPSEINAGVERYQRKTFDQILNLMMRGTIRKWVADKPDPYLVSEDRYFDSSTNQSIIKPLYGAVSINEFTGRRVITEGFEAAREKTVKCYPIDMDTQLSSDGKVNLNVDDRAIDLAEAKQLSLTQKLMDKDAVTFVNKVRQTLIVGVFLLFIVIVVIGGLFWIFQASSTIVPKIVEITPENIPSVIPTNVK